MGLLVLEVLWKGGELVAFTEGEGIGEVVVLRWDL